ncbi:uncharacterized protein L969DRAFT_613933 [Mixia osmundae IAM 14324]|uniref:J domain-containing protein n=1 Tax=Mixia osmundae (strain CBS 9802 / IAM 14324 / JCM 22182 / KY 12970) TaxID=764103 RepID=G7DS04_MIXOS|nr:uncharacterized protein L969DRAFT_613933 [Mixia osmundae IAM 14324]KEI36151.1 hypothetical protein L969DRAFT_613933 [Mixia osmundae IAM 14324]GAA93364.1 hypothetical protein E5Q_00004 [Mixia osmundae IAM 14324]
MSETSKRRSGAQRAKTRRANMASTQSQSSSQSQPPVASTSASRTNGRARSSSSAASSTASSSASSAYEDESESPNGMDVDEDQYYLSMSKEEQASYEKTVGNEYFRAGDYRNAAARYSAAIELDPAEASYLTNRAAAYMAIKSYRAALEDCKTAAELEKAQPKVKTLARLGRCQLACGLFDPASATLNAVLELDASHAEAKRDLVKLARVRVKVAHLERQIGAGDWSMVLVGLEDIEKDVESGPSAWRSWRIQALIAKKRLEEASAVASDALRLNTSDPEALYWRGRVLYLTGNNAQAIAHFQQALRGDPDYANARTGLKRAKLLDSKKDEGNSAFKASRWREAIAIYTETMTIDQENETMRFTLLSNRAVAYSKLPDHQAALRDCETVLRDLPTHYKALRTKAKSQLALEDYEAAVATFEAALSAATKGTPEEATADKELKSARIELKQSKMINHYKVLGVERDANDGDIKRAYRRQSLIHHPDKGGDEHKFKQVSEAYSILSDPQKRRRFDLGDDGTSMPDTGMGGFAFDPSMFARSGFSSQYGGGHSHYSSYGF